MTTITYASALKAIDTAILAVTSEIDLSDSIVNEITYAVNNDVQIRDYIVGLPLSHAIKECVNFVDYLARMSGDNNRYAYDTINAMYQYELENMEACKRLLESVHNINPDYSLALLISRVMSAEWPSNSFAKMRNELAPKVIETLSDNLDYIIEGVA
jgi:hypothetical protein